MLASGQLASEVAALASVPRDVVFHHKPDAARREFHFHARGADFLHLELDQLVPHTRCGPPCGTISAIGLKKILQHRMINLSECLDQIGMLFLSDLSRQECTTYTSQQGLDVPDSPTSHGGEKKVVADNNHIWRQVTRCVGHEIALLSEYVGEITNFSHLKIARRNSTLARTSPSARRTSLVLL